MPAYTFKVTKEAYVTVEADDIFEAENEVRAMEADGAVEMDLVVEPVVSDTES